MRRESDRFIRTWLHILAPAFFYVCFRLALNRILGYAVNGFPKMDAVDSGLVETLILGLMLVCTAGFYRTECKGIRPETPALALVIRSTFAGVVSGIILWFVSKCLPMQETAGLWKTTAISLCLLGPIIEEIIYRGLVYERCRTAADSKIALWVSALLFAFAHQGFSQVICSFLVGLALGFLKYKEKSIVAPICMHVAINTTTLLIGRNMQAV